MLQIVEWVTEIADLSLLADNPVRAHQVKGT